MIYFNWTAISLRKAMAERLWSWAKDTAEGLVESAEPLADFAFRSDDPAKLSCTAFGAAVLQTAGALVKLCITQILALLKLFVDGRGR